MDFPKHNIKIVAISDTHCQLEKISIPEGDILIHAGDLTWRGTYGETLKEIITLGEIGKRFQKTILISGNHDFLAENDFPAMEQMCTERGITYLQNTQCDFNGIKIYGSPITPNFGTWAFMRERGQSIQREWAKIPTNIDVLVTHGPMFNVGDRLKSNREFPFGKPVGCEDLRNTILGLKKLKLHIFGHIHHSYGVEYYNDIRCVNASACNEDYDPVNVPIVSVL